MKVYAVSLAALALVLAWVQFLSTQRVSAQNNALLTVTKTADTNDDRCDADCSLREAILTANVNPGIDTIILPSGVYTLTQSGAGEDDGFTGDLDIRDSVIISGTGVTSPIIDGGGLDRVFHIVITNTVVNLYNLIIRGGRVPVTDTLGGGGILSLGVLSLSHVRLENDWAARGGGLRNSQGSVYLVDCTVKDNTADTEGGGIYSDGSLIVKDSQIMNNRVRDGHGGGIGSSVKALLERVVLGYNQAKQGGGLYSDGELEMDDVILNYNQADQGGGLFNHYGAVVNRATFHDNGAAQEGGGLYNDDIISLTNVTISANSAARGGGIYNARNTTLLNGTIYQNRAGQSGGGIYNATDDGVVLGYSILAQNKSGDCQGVMVSQGYNIASDDTCGLKGLGDRSNTDPQLESLADNGGFTLTHAPAVTSPAVDIGGNGCALSDQRGVLRPVDADKNGTLACDSGAVELVTAGYVGFSQDTFLVQVNEDAGQILLNVRRWGDNQAVGVSYVTEDVSALGGRDYGRASGSLNWGANDQEIKTITVPILDDIYREGDETFEVRLSGPVGGAGLLLDSYKAQVIILANDADGPEEPKGGVYLPLILR